jgi:predicted ATP-grasp superfamily ATP-dependent carboligase
VELADLTLWLLVEYDYHGISNVEFKRDTRDGIAWVALLHEGPDNLREIACGEPTPSLGSPLGRR